MFMRNAWSFPLILVSLISCSALRAAEPAEQFLDALRQRGYFDMALEYLDKAETSNLAPVDFRQVIPLERGETLVQLARRESNFDARNDLLNKAQQAIEQFVTTRGNHQRSDYAKNQLGNVVAERARMKIEQAEKTGDNKYRGEAGELFDQAYNIFARRQTELKNRLTQLSGVLDPKKQKQEIDLREQLRKDYLQAQLLSAAVLEESAETYKGDKAKYGETLQRGADEYGVIYEKYRRRLAGLYAKLYRGRCLAKLGKDKDALADFEELLDNDDNIDALRPLKTNALLLALDVWMKPSQNKYMVAVSRGDEWIGQVRPNESRTPDWLTLRLQVARAHKLKADSLKKENPEDPEIKRSITEAKKLATFVSRITGDNQKAAREFLVDLGGGEPVASGDLELPATFAEAKARGKEALDSLQTAGLILRDVPARIARETNAEIKKELQAQVEEAKKTLANGKQNAYRLFKHALQVSDAETDREELNSVRYFLCYLSFTRGEYLDAAVMGEFVSRRYPEHAGARQCGKIALASYVQMHRESQDPEKAFETQQIIKIAEYMANLWTAQAEGIDALNTLIPFMIAEGDLDKAEEYLKMIPAETPQRGEAELATGKALWGRYLVGAAELRRWQEDGAPDGANPAAREAELETLKARAQGILEAGVGRMRQANPNATMAGAFLSLAQVYLDRRDPEKAIELLEDPKVGVYTLAKAGHPSTQSAGFVEETYKTALRAYISGLSKTSGSDDRMKKAQDVMTLLKQEVAQDADGQRKLVGIYIALARDLERMIALAPEAEKVPLSAGFETFLNEVGRESNEFNVLNWVAETFYSLGSGLKSSATGGAKASDYFDKAKNAYQRMIDANVVSGKTADQVRVRIAATEREMGKYSAAIKILEEILKRENMMLGIQLEAARTYQEWGMKHTDEKAKLTALNRAMKGAVLDDTKKKYIIWGWNKTSRLTNKNPKYADAHHESRFNFIKCRLESGNACSDAAKKREFYEAAERDLKLTVLLNPNLGGQQWKSRYDQLARDIQRAIGQPPVGVAAYAKKKEGAE